MTIELPDPGSGDVLSTPVWPDFSLSCTASGSHVSRIEWSKNDILVSEDNFDNTITDVNGNYSYGQHTAKQSDIVCKIRNPSCDDITNLDGIYYCTAFGTSAGWENNIQSINFNTRIQRKF